MTAYPVTLDTADLATIRAALRLYLDHGMGEPGLRPDDIHALAVNQMADECVSLDDAGVAALFERLQPDGLKAASPGADYLDRFPPEHRASADRAYQDGFADGVNGAGEESDDQPAPPFRPVFSLELDLDRLEAAGLETCDALDAASLELEANGRFLAGPVTVNGQHVGVMGFAPIDRLRSPAAQSASPDPEGQSVPAEIDPDDVALVMAACRDLAAGWPERELADGWREAFDRLRGNPGLGDVEALA